MVSFQTLADLRSSLARRAVLRERSQPIPTGISVLDRLLPEGGWRPGSLVEWVAAPGTGVLELAFRSLPSVLVSEAAWCVVDPEGTFFALPSLAGLAPMRCLIVRPQPRDVGWTVEQILRCPGIGVTWCWADSVPDRVLRRWQLAVEAGGGIGMLFRPPSAARARSWSDLRLSVTPVVRSSRRSRSMRVEVMSCRGRLGGQAVMLELHHAPDALRLVSELDNSTVLAGRTAFALRYAGRVG